MNDHSNHIILNDNNEYYNIDIMEKLNLMKTGDLIFFESDGSIGSSLIKLFMSSTITHVGMIIRLNYDYFYLKKNVIYVFEMGANTDAKPIMGNSISGSRIVEFNDILKERSSGVYLKRWFLNNEFMKYPHFANFFMNKIQTNIIDYIVKNLSIPYSLTIPSIWFMDTMFPFTLRFFHPWEYFYKPIKSSDETFLKPKHCSQMIYFVLVNANVFKDTKESYLISPMDLYNNLNDYCFPSVYYSSRIRIK